MSLVAVLDESRARTEWVYFKPAPARSTLLSGPWIETADEDRLVQSNPVVVALRARIASSKGIVRDFPEGFVPRPDTTPELSDAADRSVAESSDE